MILDVIFGVLTFGACLATAWGLICTLRAPSPKVAQTAALSYAVSILLWLLLAVLRKVVNL